jgi:ankyrin repeat protein
MAGIWQGFKKIIGIFDPLQTIPRVLYAFNKNAPFAYGRKINPSLVPRYLAVGYDINSENSTGNTLLHEAANQGNEALVSQLLAAQADKLATNKAKDTALHVAVRRGHLGVVNLILNSFLTVPIGVMYQGRLNGQGETALHIAVAQGNVEITQTLLEHGANPLWQNSVNGDTALHTMVRSAGSEKFYVSWSEIIRSLFRHGANATVLNNQEKYNPITLADMLDKPHIAFSIVENTPKPKLTPQFAGVAVRSSIAPAANAAPTLAVTVPRP